MARSANVDKVIAGIVAAYQDAESSEPTGQELIAASGVSSATFYRVIEKHADAKATLSAARAGYAANKGAVDSEEITDPVVLDPHGIVRELKAVIANLIIAIEKRDNTIRQLQRELADDDPDAPRTVTSIAARQARRGRRS